MSATRTPTPTLDEQPLHARARPPLPVFMDRAIRAHYAAGYADGEYAGHTSGLRWGVLCGMVLGLLLGCLAMWAALELGRMAGA